MKKVFQKLRGVLGNAVVWGVSWFGGSFGVLSLLGLLGVGPSVSLEFMARMATSIGITGFISGAGFAVLLGTAYRNRRLEGVRASRAALGGAVVAGLLCPLVGSTMLGSFGVGGGFLVAQAAWSTLFGAVTAGGSVKLAQRDADRLQDGSQPGSRRLASPDAL